MVELNIVEVLYLSGVFRYCYSRYLVVDGWWWIWYGFFVEYREDGIIVFEGIYEYGVEYGVWKDFYLNG